MIHAILVVNGHLADKRSQRLEKAILASGGRTSDIAQEAPPSYAGLVIAAAIVVIGIVGYAVRQPEDHPPSAPTAAVQQTPKPALPTPPQDAVPSPPSTPAPPPAAITLPATPETPRFASVALAQQEAMRRYPDLRVAGSKFNAEFVSRYQRYQRENPGFLTDTSWPVRLADEVAKALPSAPKTPSPIPTAKPPPTQREADSFLGMTEQELIRRLGQPIKVVSGDSPDGPYKILGFDETKGNATWFTIFASDRIVQSGQYRGLLFSER